MLLTTLPQNEREKKNKLNRQKEENGLKFWQWNTDFGEMHVSEMNGNICWKKWGKKAEKRENYNKFAFGTHLPLH